MGLRATLDEPERPLQLGIPATTSGPSVPCPDIFVYIVTIAPGVPSRSAVSIGEGRHGPGRFRRPGEKIGDWTILAISDDRTGLNPSVWLGKAGSVCRAELAGNPARVQLAPKRRARAGKAHRRRR
ncbi:MAG TPA: hypothetical protein VMG12_21485 [Polyangiaceae bacterium]|nr:hypothetical protein [Polyangiaceae bacterium]